MFAQIYTGRVEVLDTIAQAQTRIDLIKKMGNECKNLNFCTFMLFGSYLRCTICCSLGSGPSLIKPVAVEVHACVAVCVSFLQTGHTPLFQGLHPPMLRVF